MCRQTYYSYDHDWRCTRYAVIINAFNFNVNLCANLPVQTQSVGLATQTSNWCCDVFKQFEHLLPLLLLLQMGACSEENLTWPARVALLRVSSLMSALLKCRTKKEMCDEGESGNEREKNDKSFAVENGEIPKDEVICVVSQVNFEHNARFNLEYSLFKSFSSPSFSHFIDTYPVRRPSRHIQKKSISFNVCGASTATIKLLTRIV